MDLFNNAIGIQMAIDNQNISDIQLAILIQNALNLGKMVKVGNKKLISTDSSDRIKNDDGRTPLMFTVECEFWFGFCCLLENSKVDFSYIDFYDDTLLTIASRKEDSLYLDKILQIASPTDVNFQTPLRKMTPIMYASQYGRVKNVLLLLKQSNKDLKDRHGFSAFDFAKCEGYEKIVKILR